MKCVRKGNQVGRFSDATAKHMVKEYGFHYTSKRVWKRTRTRPEPNYFQPPKRTGGKKSRRKFPTKTGNRGYAG